MRGHIKFMCNSCKCCRNSIQTVRKWVRKVLEGRDDMDELRTGRPKTATTDGPVQRVKEAVEEDRRRTVDELEEPLSIPHSTEYRILTEELGMGKVYAKWVPHLLTEEQMEVLQCRANIRRLRCKVADFMNRIVTGDETWVYVWDPELKRQSAQWLQSSSKTRKGTAQAEVSEDNAQCLL